VTNNNTMSKPKLEEDSGSADPIVMADGLKFKGYLLQSDYIMKKHAKDKKECIGHVDSMLESAGESVLENSGRVASCGFKEVVQFVHLLLEVAAAASAGHHPIPTAQNEPVLTFDAN
jgi:hypothetical protein